MTKLAQLIFSILLNPTPTEDYHISDAVRSILSALRGPDSYSYGLSEIVKRFTVAPIRLAFYGRTWYSKCGFSPNLYSSDNPVPEITQEVLDAFDDNGGFWPSDSREPFNRGLKALGYLNPEDLDVPEHFVKHIVTAYNGLSRLNYLRIIKDSDD